MIICLWEKGEGLDFSPVYTQPLLWKHEVDTHIYIVICYENDTMTEWADLC